MTLSLATLPHALAGPTPLALVNSARSALRPTFDAVEESTHFHLKRVLDAFRKHNVGAHHFAGVDGYGHGDLCAHQDYPIVVRGAWRRPAPRCAGGHGRGAGRGQ